MNKHAPARFGHLLALRAAASMLLIGAGVLAPLWAVWVAMFTHDSAAESLGIGVLVGTVAVAAGVAVAP
jgi:hypothetical protein